LCKPKYRGMKTTLNMPALSLNEKFTNLDLASNFSIVASARKGLPPEVFYDFADAIRMPEKNLAALINLSSRTISNYKESQKKLDPIYSEHLLKLIVLFGKGEKIFGNVDEFHYWLHKPFWNSNEKPSDWLGTGGGVDFLAEELDKLAQGYPV
jgi:putative toxin-antitoxin system antitoxin component (TIGR02293 family)